VRRKLTVVRDRKLGKEIIHSGNDLESADIPSSMDEVIEERESKHSLRRRAHPTTRLDVEYDASDY